MVGHGTLVMEIYHCSVKAKIKWNKDGFLSNNHNLFSFSGLGRMRLFSCDSHKKSFKLAVTVIRKVSNYPYFRIITHDRSNLKKLNFFKLICHE